MSPRPAGRISRRSTFGALRRPAGRAVVGPLRVSWIPGAGDRWPAVGYAVGRRCGNAVQRNRLRRRLRAAVAEASPGPGSYLVVASPEAADLDFPDLVTAIGSAMTTAAAKGSPR